MPVHLDCLSEVCGPAMCSGFLSLQRGGRGVVFFFFKQKTAYEMRISDWSADVCSSDLGAADFRAAEHQTDMRRAGVATAFRKAHVGHHAEAGAEIGRASCRERVCQYV